jgi:phosphoribosyl 1,2-cyclic phosphate phosphodiesterase
LIAQLAPRQAILTNLHIDLDYAETDAATPANVTPGYDGLRIDIAAGEIIRPR